MLMKIYYLKFFDLSKSQEIYSKDLTNQQLTCDWTKGQMMQEMIKEKHELEYKLNKTSELSKQQINDLEASVDHFNSQMDQIKG